MDTKNKAILCLLMCLILSILQTGCTEGGAKKIYPSGKSSSINKGNVSKDLQKTKDITIPNDLTKLNEKQLKKLRDDLIDENLNSFSNDKAENNRMKGFILDPGCGEGLVAAVIKDGQKIETKKDLIKEIKIVKYADLEKEKLDPSGSYFRGMNEDYQLAEYTIGKGLGKEYYTYNNMMYMINHLDEVINYVDYPCGRLISNLNPEYYEFIKDNLKDNLIDQFRKVAKSGKVSKKASSIILKMFGPN